MSSSNRAIKFTGIVLFIILMIILSIIIQNEHDGTNKIMSSDKKFSNKTFKIISSSENEDMEEILKSYARRNNIKIDIEYAGTLDIMDKLNSGENYDAVWSSNSIWLYMVDNKDVKITDSKSTSINPVVFGIKKSKADELGFIGKDITVNDILEAIKSGKLKFTMSNPTQTNTGATAYLGFLTTLAGNPEVLRESHLDNENLKEDLRTLFTGMERSSGSEDFLEELFMQENGNYEAIVAYETSIININKKLKKLGSEELYALYPVDGVSISDSPFAYIDHKDEVKKEEFKKIQSYLLSNEGQAELAKLGRRTWYGGINNSADKNIFNPEWGIDTTKYLVPTKYPNAQIIKQSLNIYQTELRKPIHIVFCLDYSGSMMGEGYTQLKDAMNYILTGEEAKEDLLQFAEKDKITIIPFSTKVIDTWTTDNGILTDDLKNKISSLKPSGSTNIYDTSAKALEILNSEDLEKYNVSIVLMTDGISNRGNYVTLKSAYMRTGKQIPIYSIMFGEAYETELEEIAELTNGKIFDGKSDLKTAFKKVRGYN